MTIEHKTIQDRIKGLTAELRALEASHNSMVQENQQSQQKFQAQVGQNQTRYAQLTGAIGELQHMLKPEGSKNNEPKLSEHTWQREQGICRKS